MDDFGVVGGSLAALAHLVQLQQLLLKTPYDINKLVYKNISTQFVLLRKYLENEIKSHKKSDAENLRHYSSEKIRKLFDLLKILKHGDSAIVLVQKSFTAKILYYLLKRAASVDHNLSHVKSNFIVDEFYTEDTKNIREVCFKRSQNLKVMNQFIQKELNVVFATNVVEDWTDTKLCSYVIMFDQPANFCSYIKSKSLARDKDSFYILMKSTSDTMFDFKYGSIKKLEATLEEVLFQRKSRFRNSPTEKEPNEHFFSDIPSLEPYKPFGENGPTITALSAIPLVHKYFASLKTDKFTKITPFLYTHSDSKNKRFKCFLQLPLESKVHGIVEGTWQQNEENANRYVALKACKKLHNNGEFDLNLLPVGLNIPALQENSFMPNFDSNDLLIRGNDKRGFQIGSKSCRRTYKKKWADCLYECRPQPEDTSYLHVLNINPTYAPPASNPLILHYQQLSLPCQFALLSSKKLPPLAPFPLYSSTGELEARVEEGKPFVLNSEQLQLITDFHSTVFDEALGIVKKSMIRDFTNTENAYLIAPVNLDASNQCSIDWNVIFETILSPFTFSHIKPSDESSNKIVSPWCCSKEKANYIVNQLCHTMTETLPSHSVNYETYKTYFENKYKLNPFINNQPLIKVRALSNSVNCIKPTALLKQAKRKKVNNKNFEQCSVPEYCVVYPLVGRYWLKAQLLPSVLHRISQLCCADELRCSIARETGICMEHLPSGLTWTKLQADHSFQVVSQTPHKKQPINVPSDEKEPVDIERHMDTATLFDIINYKNFISKPPLGLDLPPKILQKKADIKIVEPPPLEMLNRNMTGKGPEQVEVMQALIASASNDLINCEKLKALGNSFLNFAISVILFETKPLYTESQLSYLKARIVGNKNLFFCGLAKKLSSILDGYNLFPNEDWVAPGFCIKRTAQELLTSANLNPKCLFNVELKKKSGVITPTNPIVEKILLGSEVASSQKITVINQLGVTDKSIADGVKALLGTYLKSCGFFGALAVLNWFRVTDPSLATPEMFTKMSISPGKSNGNPDSQIEQPDYLEQILTYKFKDRNYMLQALSHPCNRNSITVSYQRLEFIGNALIDFVITVHIFEKYTNLSPLDLADLRSTLVNKIILSALVVRHQLHKFLLHHSSTLHENVMKFVHHQEERAHIIDDDILFLIHEEEVNIAEAVDVSKTLGDIFEALVGAIYLDSGKDMNVVWKIVYNFMKDEINTFSKDVPKNHVRMLYETSFNPQFSKPVEEGGAIMVTVNILHKDKEVEFHGFGVNKRNAKRAAAKHAWRYIRNQTTQ